MITLDIISQVSITLVHAAQVEEITPLAKRQCLIRVLQVNSWLAGQIYQTLGYTEMANDSLCMLLSCLLCQRVHVRALCGDRLPGYLSTPKPVSRTL